MIPIGFEDIKLEGVEVRAFSSNTYRLNMRELSISGMVDGLASILQAVYKILNTERYENCIYSEGYGIELRALIGKDFDYVIAALPTLIDEALAIDDRVVGTNDFKIVEQTSDTLTVKFQVLTTEGNETLEMGVRLT